MNVSPRHSAVIGAVLFAATAAVVQAAPITVQTSVSTISPCPSFCGGFGGVFADDSQGGPGALSADSNLSNVDGNGTAHADLNGTSYLPNLGADAQAHASGPNVRSSQVTAVGTAMRQYLYNGPPTTIALDASLHGRATASNVNDALLRANVIAFAGPDLDAFSTDLGTLVFEIIPLTPGLSLLDRLTLNVPTNAGVQIVDGTLSLNLNDGDSFFVWGQIIASGIRGGSANGLDTLSLQFSDTTGITPLGPLGPVAVPVPPAAMLQASAMVLLAWYRRRRPG